jgi:hypothetical protein
MMWIVSIIAGIFSVIILGDLKVSDLPKWHKTMDCIFVYIMDIALIVFAVVLSR